MTSEQLQYFIIAAKHLNFSTAAKELYVTQPAISHQISMLEKELGTQLFVRSTRKVQLTRSGELFLEDAKKMLSLGESARKRVHLADDSSGLTLHIAYLLAPCQSFLPKVISLFRNKYPMVRIDLTRMDAKKIKTSLQEEQFDICFTMSVDLTGLTVYSYRELFTDSLSIICSNDHPCTKSDDIDFNKLASEHFLLFDPVHSSYMIRQIHQIFRSHNFSPQSISYLDSMDEILFEVESGLGITILPFRNKNITSYSLSYIPLTGNFSQISIGTAWKRGSDNPAIGWFLEMLDHAELQHPNWF